MAWPGVISQVKVSQKQFLTASGASKNAPGAEGVSRSGRSGDQAIVAAPMSLLVIPADKVVIGVADAGDLHPLSRPVLPPELVRPLTVCEDCRPADHVLPGTHHNPIFLI